MQSFIFSDPTCPPSYQHLGHVTEGNTCIGVTSAAVVHDPDMCLTSAYEKQYPTTPRSRYFTEELIASMKYVLYTFLSHFYDCNLGFS